MTHLHANMSTGHMTTGKELIISRFAEPAEGVFDFSITVNPVTIGRNHGRSSQFENVVDLNFANRHNSVQTIRLTDVCRTRGQGELAEPFAAGCGKHSGILILPVSSQNSHQG